MVDTATLTGWLSDLGDRAATVVERGPETWIVGVQRPLTPDEVATWSAVPGGLEDAVRAVAAGFPLVQSDLVRDGSRVVARFWAGVHGDGLARQAFLLTASSVSKAAGALTVLTRTNRDYAAAVDDLEPLVMLSPAPAPERVEPTADAPVAAADFDVMLFDPGDARLDVIATVQNALGLERAAAIDIINTAPTVIAVGVDRTRADDLARQLEAVGATVSVQPGG